MVMKLVKEKTNKRTKETIYSIISTKTQDFAIIRLEKGLIMKESLSQSPKSNQAHFVVRREK